GGRGVVCLGVYGDSGALENRGRAGRLAAARPVRVVGWYRLRRIWPAGAGWAGWREPGEPVAGQSGRVADRPGRWPAGLWPAQGEHGAAPQSGRGVLRRRPVDPQNRRQRSRLSCAGAAYLSLGGSTLVGVNTITCSTLE